MKAIPVGGGPRRAGRDRAGAPRAAERTRRLHLRRGRDQPHRQHAAVQARLRADRGRPRRADRSRLSRSRLGQHLQLQGRPVLLEVAGAHSLSGDGRVRRARCRRRRRPPRCGSRCRRSAATSRRERRADRRVARARSSSARRNTTGARSAWPTRRRTPLTFGRALVAALLLSRWIRRHAGRTSRTSACCCRRRSAARSRTSRLSLAGKVPVNLNFTAGRESMAAAIEQCGITTILTSRKFLAKAGIEPLDGMVFLEDVMPDVRAAREGCACSSPRCCCRRGCSIASTRSGRDADVARDGHLLERQHRRARRA